MNGLVSTVTLYKNLNC